MVLSLFYHLNSGSSLARAHYGLSYDTLKDCEIIIAQILWAFTNLSELKYPALCGKSDVLVVVLPWAIKDYAGRLSPLPEHRHNFQRKPIKAGLYTAKKGQILPLQEEPCIMVDSRRIIVLWYMPSSLSTKKNVSSIDGSCIYRLKDP